MADNVTSNPGVDGVTWHTDEIGGVHFPEYKLAFGPKDTAIYVSHANPFPVDIYAITTPVTARVTTTDLASGASFDLDSAQIASGKTGELVAVSISSSIPVKADLHTVLNATPSAALETLFAPAGSTKIFKFPSKKFFTVSESASIGFDGFRLTVTNLDPADAADVYVTFYYDEV